MFVIAAEGEKTEPEYFNMFNNDKTVIHIKCLKGKHNSSPTQVLARMEKYLREKDLRKGDEAWLVVDKDKWTTDQLHQLHDWSADGDNHVFSLSNPNFEYWLLLHFDDGHGISSTRECSERLRVYWPDYDKGVDGGRLRDNAHKAVERARQKDNPPCDKWPERTGTTVNKLVDKILALLD